MNHDEDIFRNFARDLYTRLEELNTVPANMTAAEGRVWKRDTQIRRQAAQFLELVEAEEEFRAQLEGPLGARVYKEFIRQFVGKDSRGLLASRPFFRERQSVCAGPLALALRNGDWAALREFHFNYRFVSFVLAQVPDLPPIIHSLARKVAAVRQSLAQENLPLAISQARTFFRKAPVKTADLRYTAMDFIQICCEGLLSAIDKFCLDSEAVRANPALIQVWRAVAIGRMRGNMIEMFSNSTVHFFPPEKRILYRTNKHIYKFKSEEGVDFERLAWFLNSQVPEEEHVDEQQIRNLLGANTWVGDPLASYERGGDLWKERLDTVVDTAPADEEQRPDIRYEEIEAREKVRAAISKLDIIELKVLALKGVDVNQL